jgi:hypothetical protein
MTKIDKFVTLKLHSIIEKYILDKIDANIKTHKLSNFFSIFNNVFAQLATYLVLSIPLYYLSQTFKFIKYFSIPRTCFCIKTTILIKSIRTQLY